jgi:hypothetical protein
MRHPTFRLIGFTLALAALGVLAGCDADSESVAGATSAAGSRPEADVPLESPTPSAPLTSSTEPSPSAPPTPDCMLAGGVSVAVDQVATIDESTSVASSEEALHALLSSVNELKAGSQALRRVDVKALNEGLAEVASAVSSASRAESVDGAVPSLQGSARDLEAAINDLEAHFGCNPAAA